jgi:hypothetical protein
MMCKICMRVPEPEPDLEPGPEPQETTSHCWCRRSIECTGIVE